MSVFPSTFSGEGGVVNVALGWMIKLYDGIVVSSQSINVTDGHW